MTPIEGMYYYCEKTIGFLVAKKAYRVVGAREDLSLVLLTSTGLLNASQYDLSQNGKFVDMEMKRTLGVA